MNNKSMRRLVKSGSFAERAVLSDWLEDQGDRLCERVRDSLGLARWIHGKCHLGMRGRIGQATLFEIPLLPITVGALASIMDIDDGFGGSIILEVVTAQTCLVLRLLDGFGVPRGRGARARKAGAFPEKWAGDFEKSLERCCLRLADQIICFGFRLEEHT